ncbi:MAG TPA: NnrS family protein, partial [Tepidisphaeraceae bacterium]|nr:NnrS family protein [Tepidisphaeraceae bacterium]
MSSVALSLTVRSAPASARIQRGAPLTVLGASRGPDLTFRPFFVASLLIGITAGATWGALMLLQAALAGRFTAVSIWHMNAHAHAQIYGFVTLMILGFAYQAFPRFWAAPLALPMLGRWVLLAMLAGIGLQSAAWLLASPTLTPPLSLAAGTLEAAALCTFFVQLLLTRRRSSQPMDVSTLLLVIAAGLLPLHAVAESLHAIAMVGAESRSALLSQLADWQTPLRNLQLRGTVLFMIVGVAIRVLPRVFVMPPIPERAQRRLLSLMLASLIAESSAFILMRQTG